MPFALLKCYVSVVSSSEEEFAGFPEEDSTISAEIPQFPIVLPSETDSSSDEGDSDGSFSTGPILKKR